MTVKVFFFYFVLLNYVSTSELRIAIKYLEQIFHFSSKMGHWDGSCENYETRSKFVAVTRRKC